MLRKLLTVAGLIVIGEAAWLGHDILRNWEMLMVSEPLKAEQREAADEYFIEQSQQHEMVMGTYPIVLGSTLECFRVDKLGRATRHEGLTPTDTLESLEAVQDQNIRNAEPELLPRGTSVVPFFYKGAKHEVATTSYFGGPGFKVGRKGESFALASVDDRLVFIRMANYRRAGLPLQAGYPNANWRGSGAHHD